MMRRLKAGHPGEGRNTEILCGTPFGDGELTPAESTHGEPAHTGWYAQALASKGDIAHSR
jgi:hypothetical protein